MLMKDGRYLIKKIIKMSIFSLIIIIGLTFITGFYYERNAFINLNDITIELGDKLPEEITNYVTLLNDKSNLTIESDIPLDEDGNTTIVGKFNYYLVYNDDNYKFSRLTNTKSTITVIDTIKPIINITKTKFDYGSKIKAENIATCLDLSGCKMILKEEINTTKSGEYEIHIEAYDGANNINSITAKITIKEKPKPVIVYNHNMSFQNMDKHNNEKNALLTEEEKINLRKQIAEFAKRFVGNPYVYGGTSLTNGADCSGFTMSIYANYGYKLPRVSTDQAYIGKSVSESELQPGDLVVYFYEGHVGIYVGNGMMVHASTPQNGILYAKMYPGKRMYRRIIY